jgi:ribosome-associated heat shock protein Hsp15
MTDAAAPARVRLDIWLDIACLFKTRSAAQKACQMGRVEVNGQRAKAHRDIKSGDVIIIQRPLGRRQKIVVRELANKHIAKSIARHFYDDLTPAPTADEIELRRLAALARPHRLAMGTPDKRQRRALRRMKEFEGDR